MVKLVDMKGNHAELRTIPRRKERCDLDAVMISLSMAS